MNTEIRFPLFRMVFTALRYKPISGSALLLLSIVKGFIPSINVLLTTRMVSIIAHGYLFNSNQFRMSFILLFGVYLSTDLIEYCKSLLSNHVVFGIESHLQKDLMEKASRVNFRYRELDGFSDKLHRSKSGIEAWRIAQLIKTMPDIFTHTFTIIGILLVLFTVSWFVPILNLSILFLSLFFLARSSKIYFDALRKASKEERMVSEYAQSLIKDNILAELKIHKRYEWMRNIWRTSKLKLQKKLRKENAKKAFYEKSSTFLIANGMICFSVLFIVLFLPLETSLESIVLVLNSTSFLGGATFGLIMTLASFADYRELFKDYFSYIEIPDDNVLNHCIMEKGNDLILSCRDLSFSYDGQHNAVNGINLDVKKGEKIVVVGENGSGKSTLAKLILGLYRPDEGKIVISKELQDDNDFKASVVFQDFERYEINMRFNVGSGDLAFIDDSDKILNSLKRVDFDEDIGLDEQLGMQFGGREFSGGQWQKIAVARGSYKDNAQFMILDEPTSSLDALAETQIISTFLNEFRDRTCLFISHRLSSIQLADRIIVMKGGSIVEVGTHSGLMKEEGVYHSMFTTQAELYV